MNSLARVLTLMLIALPSALILAADTVILKTGETLTGTIIRENESEIVLDYKVSASISDQRSIPRSEIEKMQKEQPDEIAYNAIQGYKLDPEWSMQPESYTRALQALTDFVTRFPNNPHCVDIQNTLAAITAEKNRVTNGEIKMFGNWLTKEQAGKQQSQIQAQTVFGTMREQAMRGDLIGALNTFETMKTTCKTSIIFPGAIQLAGSILQSLQRQAAFQRQSIAKEEANWTSTIAMAAEPRKSQLIATHNAMLARAEAAANASAPAKGSLKWTPPVPNSIKSLDALEAAITAEKTALQAFPVAKMRNSIDRVNKASDALSAKDPDTAEAYLKEAQGLWPENGALEYIKSEIASVKAAATPTPAPTPTQEELAKIAKKKAAAAVAASTPVPEEVPFYMTSKGAGIIVVSVLVLAGIVTGISRLIKKPKAS